MHVFVYVCMILCVLVGIVKMIVNITPESMHCSMSTNCISTVLVTVHIHCGIFLFNVISTPDYYSYHYSLIFTIEMSSSDGEIEDAVEMTANGNVAWSIPDTSVGEERTVHSSSTNSAHQQGESATNKELKVPTYLRVVAATIALFLMTAVFVCAVLSKTAFMAIAARLYVGNTTSTICQNTELVRQQSVAFVQLMIVLCVPQAFTALRTLFFGVLKAQETFPWPSVRSLALVSGSYVAV